MTALRVQPPSWVQRPIPARGAAPAGAALVDRLALHDVPPAGPSQAGAYASLDDY